MPTKAKLNFDKTIARVDSLLEVHQELAKEKGRPPLWMSDILRSAMVFILAAFDSYVHDVISENFYKVITKKKGLSLPKKLLDILRETVPYEKSINLWFTSKQAQIICGSIRKRNSERSYMKPEKIEEGLSVLGIDNLWRDIARNFGRRRDGLKTLVRGYAERRDKIAHEGDIIKPSFSTGRLRGITRPYLEKCLKDIRKIVAIVDDIVLGKVENKK